MISEQRTVVIILSITVLFLLCYLAMPHFQSPEVIGHGKGKSAIRVSSLKIKNTSFVNDSIPSRISTSSSANNGLAGQSLELEQAHSLRIKMYRDRKFLYEQYLFDSSEKVFLVLEFDKLEAGEHDILVLWTAPNGQPVNTSRHNISLPSLYPQYRAYFWLKLIRNGMFTEMITGEEYKGEIHGQWDAEIYFNGDKITKQHFMIFD